MVGGVVGAGTGVDARACVDGGGAGGGGGGGGGWRGRGFGSCRHGPEETTERFLLGGIQLGQPVGGEETYSGGIKVVDAMKEEWSAEKF